MKLFSFPYLIADELLKHFKSVELVNLSLCSKNAYEFVKTYSKTKEEGLAMYGSKFQHALCLSGQRQVSVWVTTENDRFFTISEFETHQGFYWSIRPYLGLLTYSVDAVHGCKEFTNHICDLFEIPVSTVIFTEKEDFWILDFVRQRQEKELEKVHTEMFDTSAEDYSRILGCNATELLELRLTPPTGYRFEGRLPPVKDLRITNANWITREHLLGLECQNVHLAKRHPSTFPSQDVNGILRSWLEGGLSNLKHLRLTVSVTRFDDYLRARMERVQRKISYKWKQDEQTVEFRSEHSFHIRRDDNVVATIKHERIFFTMVVWPDLDGNRI